MIPILLIGNLQQNKANHSTCDYTDNSYNEAKTEIIHISNQRDWYDDQTEEHSYGPDA